MKRNSLQVQFRDPLVLPFPWEFEAALIVLLNLCEVYSLDDCWPSTNEIAKAENMDRRTVNATLKRLRSHGLVSFRRSASGLGSRGAGWRLRQAPSLINAIAILDACALPPSSRSSFWFAHIARRNPIPKVRYLRAKLGFKSPFDSVCDRLETALAATLARITLAAIFGETFNLKPAKILCEHDQKQARKFVRTGMSVLCEYAPLIEFHKVILAWPYAEIVDDFRNAVLEAFKKTEKKGRKEEVEFNLWRALEAIGR